MTKNMNTVSLISLPELLHEMSALTALDQPSTDSSQTK